MGYDYYAQQQEIDKVFQDLDRDIASTRHAFQQRMDHVRQKRITSAYDFNENISIVKNFEQEELYALNQALRRLRGLNATSAIRSVEKRIERLSDSSEEKAGYYKKKISQIVVAQGRYLERERNRNKRKY